MIDPKRIAPCFAFCFVFAVDDAQAQCEDKQIQEIANPMPTVYGGIANQMAFDGVTLAVSASPIVNGPGTVLVFEKVGAQFALTAQLKAPDGISGSWDGFGSSIAIDDDYLFVGAAYSPPHQSGQYFGAIYCWKRQQGSWTFDAKVVPPVLPGEFVGTPIAASTGWLVAAVPGADGTLGGQAVQDVGKLFVYRRNASDVWQLNSTLVASAPIQGQTLGFPQVAIDGSTLIAPSSENTVGSSWGSINVFEFDGAVWSQTSKLIPSSAANGTGWFAVYGFGIFGSRIIGSSDSGDVFVFEKASSFWVESGELPPPPSAVLLGSEYGRPTALGDGLIAVGADQEDTPFTNAGAAYVFALGSNGWKPRIRLAPNDPKPNGGFGTILKIGGAVVAATSPVTTGAVYLMSATPNPEPDYGVSCVGTGGYAPTLSLPLSFDGCFKPGDSAAFKVEKGLGGSACLILVGASPAAIPIPGPCSLLVSPSAANATVPLFGFGPGNGTVSFSATLPVTMPAVSIYLQGFIPDSGVASGFSATNGLRLTVY